MRVEVYSACIDAGGNPCMVAQTFNLSQSSYDEGDQYAIAEQRLYDEGYEKPMVHFVHPIDKPEHSEVPDYLKSIIHLIPHL